MLLRFFYDKALAHASYLVGCQKTGEAIVVDPGRDIEGYLEVARQEGVRIVGVAETHIHADYVSGAREIAHLLNAKLYVSDEGPAEWKYQYVDQYEHQLLHDGDTFQVGRIEFRVLHTPGHTPESISFVLTDRGGGADQPMGIFTGDFIFVGSIGRPDLLEEAAGIMGTAEPGARDLFRSMKRFRELPEYLQVWPAHGAGSACGKGLGAIPSSTVGYENRFNPALQFDDEQAFVDYILADQPEAPQYFAAMKRVNKEGPAILGESVLPARLPVSKLPDLANREFVIDTATATRFGTGHVPGTINIEAKYMAMWGGSLFNENQKLYLIAGEKELPEVVRVMHKIGLDQIVGYFDADEVADAGLDTAQIPQFSAEEVSRQLAENQIELIDVRGATERQNAMIEGSQARFLGRMLRDGLEFDFDKPVVFQCQGGGRSMIAASLAQRAGVKSVGNLDGGLNAWRRAGLPVYSGDKATSLSAG